jgi:acyl-coenzyme A synthetase/AMP-(fatty) acid ligase
MAKIPHPRYSNLYGPTETNVCTYYDVPALPEDTDETIPIGVPCSNVEALIVDSDDQPVPEGEVGELLIRGGVVMRGYWGRPDLTEEGFHKRPAFGYLEDTFYRTGDLVQLQEDGNLRYLGRKDRQIKTRGYRVELDEIEVALLSYDLVQEAAVYPVPDGEGSNLIEASVVPKTGVELDKARLVGHISKRLPAYAVPVHVHIMEKFPRTSTGKINRRELQAMANTASEQSA